MDERTPGQNRYNKFKRFFAATIFAGELILPGCAPRTTPPNPPGSPVAAPVVGSPRGDEEGRANQIEKTIQGVNASLEHYKATRPDCFIVDVQKELDSLAKGIDTHSYRSLDGETRAIENIRQERKRILQESAIRILETSTPIGNQREMNLASTYSDLYLVERKLADEQTNEELKAEYSDLKICDLVKLMSLATPPYIEYIRNGGIPPNFPAIPSS